MKYPRTVACMIWFGDKIMLAKRTNTDTFSGYWEAAGGKLEEGEQIIPGLQREISEETNLFILHGEIHLLDCITDDPTTDKCFIFKAKCGPNLFKIVSNPEPDKRTTWQLFSREEAKTLKLMPGLIEYL